MDIVFQKPADAVRLSAYDRAIITALAAAAGLTSVLVTRTAATPADQARAMFDNCVNVGIDAQFDLYGPVGDKVIRVAADAVPKNADRKQERQALLANAAAIRAAMEAKIRELGPENVSHHCVSDWSKLHVFDIAASNMPMLKRERFEAAIKREPRIARHFSPYTRPEDPAFHLEVKQQ